MSSHLVQSLLKLGPIKSVPAGAREGPQFAPWWVELIRMREREGVLKTAEHLPEFPRVNSQINPFRIENSASRRGELCGNPSEWRLNVATSRGG